MNFDYKLFLCLLVFVGLFQHAYSQCTMTSQTANCVNQLGQGATFAESAQLDASASVTLTVDIGTVTYNWLELKRRMYNGKIAGPTLTVRQGNTLSVSLVNSLIADGNDLGNPLNEENYPNSTNLHTHGLHISSANPQDNVLIHLNPGGTQNYVYQIHADNAPGTNWYHAHLHGSTMFQVHSGLSGMLIVEDNVADMPTELAAVSCPDNCDKDIQLLFQPILQYSGNRGFATLQSDISDYTGFQLSTDLQTYLSTNLNRFTTNGQIEPDLAMTTGQMYRFRMVNAGGSDTLELYIVDTAGTSTSACTIREIATDGVYLNAPRAPHDGQSLLVPAARVDWMVKCDTAGTYYIKSFGDATHRLSIGGITRFEGNMVKLTVSGTAVSPAQTFPSTLPARPSYMNDLQTVSQADIGGRFNVELDPATTLNREKWSSGTYYRYKMTVGTTQEWNLLNTDTGASHPIHIHVNHFQVISYNNYTGGYSTGGNNWQLLDVDTGTACAYQYAGATTARRKRSYASEEVLNRVKRQGPGGGAPGGGDDAATDDLEFLGHNDRFTADAGDTLGYARLGDWRDVLLVPPLANITVRFNAHEHTGDVIIHCHILAHEDSGMMMIVSIVPTGENTDANTPSGDAYPGTCGVCDRYPSNNVTTVGMCGTSGTRPVFDSINVLILLFLSMSTLGFLKQ